MSLQDVTTTISEKIARSNPLGATIKFNLGDAGLVFIDGKSEPQTVSNSDTPADCTIKVALADLQNMLKGELDPMVAFSLGKIELDGDMAVAMKLGELINA